MPRTCAIPRWTLVFASLAIGGVVIARPARARGDEASEKITQPTQAEVKAARALFIAGRKDEEAGRWTDALEKFRRVADVKRTAGVRYHVALCEEKLGLTATAYADYAEAQMLAQKENSREVSDLLVEPFLSNMRARVPTLALQVPVDVAGTEVTLDQKPYPSGLWGIALPIDPGLHHVEARAPGHTTSTYDVTLKEREAMSLDVALVPVAPIVRVAPIAAPTPVTIAPAPPHAEPPKKTRAQPPPTVAHDESPSRTRTGAIVATAGAVVLAGGGVAAFLLAGSAQSDARAQCLGLRDCGDLKTSTRAWDTLALGAWIGAGVVGTVAVVLWASPSSSRSDASARLTAGPGALRLEGTF